ncbi:hypothetical protein A3757_04800 [Oleiphilus sp. HI0117]|nr:hypothetical protein A3757_04800 [Oleiphilus sp. HI0117]KZZ57757.1 hypothetical protein A3761_06500 [Oleiphilus sp. HI0123]
MCLVEMKAPLILSISLPLMLIASKSLASQPINSQEKSTIATYQSLAMSESDMDDVSAIAGISVLDIYGSPAAGLTVDSEDDEATNSNGKNSYNEAEDTQDFASHELKKIEDGGLATTQASNDIASPTETLTIEDNSVVSGAAQSFTTTSEINYKPKNFQHEMKQLSGDSISISRNLHVDLLKIENLSGDHYDESRSAGSIYLSDWTSRGNTILTPR